MTGSGGTAARRGDIVIVSPDQPHAFVNSGAGRLRQIDVHLSSRFATEWLDARPGPAGASGTIH